MQKIEITRFRSHAQPMETWIASHDGDVIGHIYLLVETDKKIKFLDAWVHPEWRGKGVYRRLWERRWEDVKAEYSGHTVYAWCKSGSLPLLLEKGFEPGEQCTYVEKKIE